jgi:hypothetical protein
MDQVAVILQLAVVAVALFIYGVTYFLDRRTSYPARDGSKDHHSRNLVNRHREML